MATGGGNQAERTAALARRVREGGQGEAESFAELARLYWPEVYAMLYRRTADRAEAEDLCQEAFARAWAARRSLRRAAGFRGWLYGIALNQWKSALRRRRLARLWGLLPGREEPPDAPDQSLGEDGPLQEAARASFWRKVAGFCQGLPPREAEAFRLRFLDGLSLPEISQALGTSPSAAKTHLYRAVAKLKDSPLAAELAAELEGGGA
jgi:RNA polymerase sigma-70 factor (ECF subfamily)